MDQIWFSVIRVISSSLVGLIIGLTIGGLIRARTQHKKSDFRLREKRRMEFYASLRTSTPGIPYPCDEDERLVGMD